MYWRVTTRSPRGQFSGRAQVVRCDGLVVSPTQSATDAETSEDSGPEDRYPGRSRTTTWQRNLAIDGGANVLEGMPPTPIQTCKLDLRSTRAIEIRRLSPRRVPEQRSRPLEIISWQGLALLIPVEASAQRGDAERRVASRAMVHWTAAQLDWLRGP